MMMLTRKPVRDSRPIFAECIDIIPSPKKGGNACSLTRVLVTFPSRRTTY